MNHRILSAAWLFIAALAPVSVSAALIEVSDVTITSFASYTTQGQPTRNATDTKRALATSLNPGTDVLLLVDGAIPFPNVPTTQTQAFVASAADFSGSFGIGASGFFFEGSLPPNNFVAGGSLRRSVTNNSASTVSPTLDFVIPAPTIRVAGPRESPPRGIEDERFPFAFAFVEIRSTVFHPDGTSEEFLHLDYGFDVFREAASGQFVHTTDHRDSVGLVSRFDGPDGQVFQLPDLVETGFALPELGPGDGLSLGYDFFAAASTGFPEAGAFAAIGDPFNLNAGGGRFDIQVGEPSAVPEPGTSALLGLGLVLLGISRRWRRRSHHNRS